MQAGCFLLFQLGVLIAGCWDWIQEGYFIVITEFSFFLLLFIFNQTVHPRSREAVLQRELNRPRADRLSL